MNSALRFTMRVPCAALCSLHTDFCLLAVVAAVQTEAGSRSAAVFFALYPHWATVSLRWGVSQSSVQSPVYVRRYEQRLPRLQNPTQNHNISGNIREIHLTKSRGFSEIYHHKFDLTPHPPVLLLFQCRTGLQGPTPRSTTDCPCQTNRDLRCSLATGANLAEAPGFCVGNFTANSKGEIPHTKLTAPEPPPPCTKEPNFVRLQ